MGCCLKLAPINLNAEKICEQINKFFAGMAARKLDITQIVDEIKVKILSGQITDLPSLKQALTDKTVNSEFAQTSQQVIELALDDAEKNFGDKTLPFLCLLFLSDSNLDKFIEAFKAINLAQHAESTAKDVKNTVEAVKSGGLLAGLASGLSAAANAMNTVQQAANPNEIKRDDLKKLITYYINFITLLPVNILEQCHEGGEVENYVSKVLTSAFSKEVQNNFIEQRIFAKYNAMETIEINQFFTDNYPTLDDDKGIRIGLVNSYIQTLDPADIRALVGGGSLFK